METTKSIEIIQNMMQESRKSLARYSFYFIMWGIVMGAASLLDYMFNNYTYHWAAWPAAGILGGIASSIFSYRDKKKAGASTFSDRIIGYTWLGFGIALIVSIAYTANHHLSPSPMVLLLAGFATFITGGICRFKPFVYGGLVLILCSVISGFFLPDEQHGLVFVLGMVLGYIVPGVMLRNTEGA